MHSGVIFIGCLCLISWLIQLLPVISVPITGKSINYDLHLCSYNNITFGIFGVCDISTGACSDPKIGYPIEDFVTDTESYEDGVTDGLSGIELPSNATYYISKLLVVHVLAFFFTSLLLLETCLILFVSFLDDLRNRSSHHTRWVRQKKTSTDTETSDSFSIDKLKPIKRDTTPYYNWMVLFALLSFLSTLLAFLADVLLFVPELSYLGWIQLLPISLMALIASLVCFFKRSVSSRKHLEDDVYPANEMRGRARNIAYSVDSDSDSDDGFYIYTNAFHGGGTQRVANSSIHEILDTDNDMNDSDIELQSLQHRSS
ncbi:SUR7/PalI family protein [Clavispora lusitaniae]|uniref:PH-response regulator protein palI/RIM9 n=2 Tax=Clavispora lusitaniae TaxID=36911 RepID=C4Y8X5_CLAL4|nr:uncharacterized protein CLUG_04653 [Clavispora lusitaniae ATCC 42720]EEQ40525.1 hypothetical protein CLUG_04653 [Clavispora lusitaniae ATCC 42720]KAF5209535.1 regulator of ime2 [Clavispora lusitaniae]KAF7581555.1 SUR7/PalI family protein [Clavispora lusitaniae]OVF07797.1 putative pH-response regulator protein [Clavispora lusitaniae]